MSTSKNQKKKILLSLAGYDPSGGAGAILDLQVFQHLGFRGMSLLTAVTSQNTGRVSDFRSLPPGFLLSQYRDLTEENAFSGLKVGMVGSKGNARAIGLILDNVGKIPVVVDPVIRSSSGSWLFDRTAIPFYLGQIKGKISILTPNLREASLMAHRRVETIRDMKETARKISQLAEAPALIKGGHLLGKPTDILYDGRRFYLFEKKRIRKDVHGTGCFFSSSLLCFLVKRYALPQACRLASEFTGKAIEGAEVLGSGRARISFPL